MPRGNAMVFLLPEDDPDVEMSIRHASKVSHWSGNSKKAHWRALSKGADFQYLFPLCPAATPTLPA
jgi:hypothetical protein